MSKSRRIQSDEKLLDIIEYLGGCSEGATVSEVSDVLDMPVSTVYVHLSTLCDRKYLVKDDENRYHLSLRFLALGGNVREYRTLYRSVSTVLKNLAEETGESIWFVVEEQGQMFFVSGVRGEKAIRTDVRVGLCTSLVGTPEGRVLLAFLPEGRREQLVQALDIPTDRQTYLQELTEIRQRGWDSGKSKLDEAVSTVAAPVIDNQGNSYGAILIAGPGQRMEGRQIELGEVLVSNISDFNVSISYNRSDSSLDTEVETLY